LRTIRSAAAAAILALSAFATFGTTLLPLTDRQLVERADAVVSATVVDGTSRVGEGGYVVTDYRLRVENVFKGSAPADVVVTEVGGVFAGRFTVIADAPSYARGERVLAFLRARGDGTWFTASMALGKLTYSDDRSTLTSAATESSQARVMNAGAFERYVRDTAAGVPASGYAAVSALAHVPTTLTTYPASPYCLLVPDQLNVTLPVRIPGGESGGGLQFYVNGTQSSVATASTLIANAEGAWTGDPNSAIVVKSATGTDASTAPAVDGHSVIYLGYSAAPPASALCDNAGGCAIISGTSDHSFNGESFHSISEADILIRPTVGSAQFGVLMTHELGHAIGLRHSDEQNRTPNTSFAVMATGPLSSYGTTLQPYDKDAVDTVYGNGPVCNQPAITATTNSATVNSGAQLNLSVTASGTTPFTYQWYNGASGDTSSPIANATASTYLTPPITSTRSFWVRLTNSCGNASSNTITLTVGACLIPTITAHPQNVTVNLGDTATLSVSANGTAPLTYQWYTGTSGDVSTPMQGSNNPIFVTPAISKPITTFWVRVSNSCGAANSVTAVVTTPDSCSTPTITTQPKDATINVGDSPTLSVAAVGGTLTYQWYQGPRGDTSNPIAGATGTTLTNFPLFTAGPTSFWVKVTNSCGPTNSNAAIVTVGCAAPRPVITVPATAPGTSGFTVSWNGDGRITNRYELQESATPDFGNASTIAITDGTSHVFSAKNNTADRRYYYRVRSFAICGGQPSEYSITGPVLVTAPPSPSSNTFNFAQPPCSCTITQPLTISGLVKNAKTALATQDTFSITSDAAWLTVSPSTGPLPPEGTTVTVTIDTTNLNVGSTQATLTINKSAATANAGTLATTTSAVPLTVSLVSPVTPTSKDASGSNTLLVPAVAHADGVGSQFVSDVRVTNTTSALMQYLLSYTPGATDGTTAGKQMKVSIAGGDTLALNDIVKSWFGAGAVGEGGIGSIEIRPLDANASSHATVAASRTYAVTSTGTFGQFIPALPISNFLGKSSTSFISLQQIAQSTSFRTNFGFVEGSGQPADLELRLFDAAGRTLDTKTLSLKPFELAQLSLQQVFPNATLQDGRMEARVVSDTGKVSAYASVLDNRTNDPLLVLPVDPSKVAASTYVLPGIGDFDIGVAHWKSDVRVYNSGTSSVRATLMYYPQGGGTPRSFDVTVQPGETQVLDNFIGAQFPGMTQTAGSLVATAPANSSLVATARTYTDTGSGTYGQFIPGVSPTDGVGAGERLLQVLQLEESPSFHTNAGVVELTGNPVHVRVHGYVPDGRTSAIIDLDVAPFQFVQLNRIFAAMGYGNVYNGRVAVEVTSGTGRITAYASNIDNRTQDPTYVPAQ
jgi:hypothetical protein